VRARRAREDIVYEFKLPDLGEGIHEGEIITWHVEVGDRIEEDAPLVEIETDKVTVTIPSPKAGTIKKRNGKVGDTIETGQVIVVIDTGEDGADAPEKPREAEEKQETKSEGKEEKVEDQAEKEGQAEPEEKEEPPEAKPGRRERPSQTPVPAAPATRRLARELSVDINTLEGSGPTGRVIDEDVRRAAKGEAPEARHQGVEAESKQETARPAAREQDEQPGPPAPSGEAPLPFLDLDELPDFERYGEVERVPLRSIRRRTARRMMTSMTLIPHVAHMDEADVTELETHRRQMRERYAERIGAKLTPLVFVVKALVAALKLFPAFNASLDPFRQEIVYKKHFHIGIAVDSGAGLVVPVVRDADRKSMVEIAREIERLAKKAREGALEVADMQGGTCTVTNVGVIGGTSFIPAINYPESAILGMAGLQQRPVVRDGRVVVRTMLPLTLSFDHRVTDGADAARFMNALKAALEDVNLLGLEA
jgi:pyruvate dehydrogenase E2 component (dihydrolipoamide acetyltransferase)